MSENHLHKLILSAQKFRKKFADHGSHGFSRGREADIQCRDDLAPTISKGYRHRSEAGLDFLIDGGVSAPVNRLQFAKQHVNVSQRSIGPRNKIAGNQNFPRLSRARKKNSSVPEWPMPQEQMHARIAGTAALELSLNGGRYALATMCIGVGQGVAVALERV